ncbi:MerR family transcriptional regulator [Novosphingobium sp.]|uniref:MerR family transcriptional regulator n=1 Tax=Novosphingobium sp. TaxID=1874826 RepID=UPI0025ED3BF6|nr:MerR family transcriptional regulator [Novosphingobium sp.]
MAKTISELARAGEVGVETVRYYQRRGLLFDPRPGAARSAGRRHYGDDEVKRLRFIRSAQRAGFTLDEIGDLVAPHRTRQEVRSMARMRIEKLAARIAELESARTWLGELVAECSANEVGPCPIIEAFTAR